MNGKCRGDLLGRPTFYGKSGVYLALLTMQYATKTYSTLSRISLLNSRRVYQITVQRHS